VTDWLVEANRALLGWGPALATLVVGALLGWLGGTLLYRRLRHFAARTATRLDDVALQASRGLWFPVAFFLALLLALRFAPVDISEGAIADLARFAKVALLLTLTVGASRFAALWFAGHDGAETAHPSLLANAARGAVILVGGMLVLENSGFAIAPLLTALGVGSLAVGLALQPTLSNFFAGLYLSTSKPIRVGDFIELEDGTQGEVVDIGWRATRVRQIANNLAIVPNSRLGEMRILNYSQPAMPQAAIVTVGVAYGSDLERVERIAMEVAREVQRDRPEADSEHAPAVRFHTFGASSIDLNIVLRARTVTDRPPLVHEFVKRIKARFDAEGIEIPFPQRVVHLPAAANDAPPAS
jgi:small-conductance mechanosensitive channel